MSESSLPSPFFCASSRKRTSYSTARAACCALAVALAATMTGCTATGGSGSGSTPDEFMTSSDMTDARRRAIIRLQLAVSYMERDQLEIALDEAKRAVAADPGYSAAYNVRGLIYNQLGDKKMAEESFRRAVATNARDGDAQHNLAFALCEQGHYAQAQQFFEAALANPLYRNKERTQVAQAVCESRAGNIATAETLLLSAYEDGSRSPVVANALANIYYQQQNYRRAALYASQANARGHGTAASLWLAMKIEKQLGNNSTVQRYARQLREDFPDSRELRLYERGAWNN